MKIPNSKFQIPNFYCAGQAVLTTVIFLLFVSTAVLFGFSIVAFSEIRLARGEEYSTRSYALAEAGVEDVAYRIRSGKLYSSSNTLAIDGATTTTTVEGSGSLRNVTSRGDVSDRIRIVKIAISNDTVGISFDHGVQIGDGGLEMGQGSRVVGSVYSNGSISGSSGATIVGDVFVAEGNVPTVDQQWTTQNSDYAVGTIQGAVTTAVDTAGDVGEYTAITLGQDGFARISYYDASNKDLKFVRCTNTDCTEKNIATVDATGDVGWRYTSIGLGDDGFARISYYSNTNGDLKFARCANDDCTAKNITVIDSSGDVGQFSSMAFGGDDFARISYHAISGGNLKFVRCTNADCTARNVRTIDTPGTVGTYTALVLDEDGLANISYRDDSNEDLKYARCTNADCTSSVITVVDNAGDLGQYKTSIALGGDGFARISYYDDASGDLKFVRCTDMNCTTRNIAIVDSSGDTGRYSSLELGSNGYARISYYDASSGNLKFAECLNDDCSSRNISTVDSLGDVGRYSSLSLGVDEFGRISYYGGTSKDLKFVRCRDAVCSPSTTQIDVAQSFRPTITSNLTDAELYLKKIGSPANATLRVIKNSGGSPSTRADDVIATAVINTSQIGTSYGWFRVSPAESPTLNADTAYWLVIDAERDDSNYLVWGLDSGAGYTRGEAKQSADWTDGGWTAVSGDLNFRVYMGGVENSLEDVRVEGSASANIMDSVDVTGNANTSTYSNGTVDGNINTNSISSCTIVGNAAYNSVINCMISGATTTPTTPPEDPARLAMPISTSTINAWKVDAEIGGTCAPPECLANGNYAPTACEVSLGPKKITGNLILSASCPGGQLLTVTGTIWVVGNIEISNNARVRLAASFEDVSGVVLSDGTIHLSNNGQFSGSGIEGSYLMLLSLATGGGHHGSAIDLHNNAEGAIFYAANGMVYLHNNVIANELTGYKVHLENNAEVHYESALENARFYAGGGTGFDIRSWRETE